MELRNQCRVCGSPERPEKQVTWYAWDCRCEKWQPWARNLRRDCGCDECKARLARDDPHAHGVWVCNDCRQTAFHLEREAWIGKTVRDVLAARAGEPGADVTTTRDGQG